MTRRRFLILGWLAALVAAGMAGWLLLSRDAAIITENTVQLKPGITLAEDEATSEEKPHRRLPNCRSS
jgi:hypothetical protein